jgi:two-component system chemotaxis response regulator CheB
MYWGFSRRNRDSNMGKTRILIVNDAVVIRRLVTAMLTDAPDLEVVGTAANGRIALTKMDKLHPDLVLLDVEMPEMDGMETLAALRKSHPQVPVIMLSRFTRRGSPRTLEALSLGARDYIPLPEQADGRATFLQDLRAALLAKIELHGLHSTAEDKVAHAKNSAPPPAISPDLLPRTARAIDVVAIGASTGGPNALAAMLSVIPADFPVPLLVVQHMPAMFTPLLANRLSAQCAIEVVEASPGDTLTPGKAWLAPGDYHLALARDGNTVCVRTHQDAPENSCRPSVDVLFRSAADVFGSGVLAVVLTGMGCDGLRGCERVREKGGQILAQDEATSVVWGMPGFVARAALADQVLPLGQIGPEVTRRVKAKTGYSSFNLRR